MGHSSGYIPGYVQNHVKFALLSREEWHQLCILADMYQLHRYRQVLPWLIHIACQAPEELRTAAAKAIHDRT